jgi:competence protein ComEA
MDTIIIGGDNMLKLDRSEEKVILVIIVILICAAIFYKFISFKTDNVSVAKKEDAKTNALNNSDSSNMYVYITGEVVKPGLYKLKSGDRVQDAINMAGGVTANADITSVNPAEKLKDEQYINIAKKEANVEPGSTSGKQAISGGKININMATAKELDEFLPGIGETYANRIVDYREKNGRFKSIDEITKVEGIGSGKRFESIKKYITI